MKQWSHADHDCREVLVEVEGSAAVVSVVTRDGRRASRITRDPASVVPVATALTVGLDQPAPSSSAVDAAPPSPGVSEEHSRL